MSLEIEPLRNRWDNFTCSSGGRSSDHLDETLGNEMRNQINKENRPY